MKIISLLAIVFSVAASAADQPLISKHSSSGFTSPEWVRYESCEIFSDSVLITKQFGGGTETFTVTEKRALQFSGNLELVIAKAASEILQRSDNGLCDGPTTTVSFESQGVQQIVYTNGGCGSPMMIREGAYSNMILNLINAYCPTTHTVRN